MAFLKIFVVSWSMGVAIDVSDNNITVLVFGDSYGALGPKWTTMQDMFDKRGIQASVVSVAKSGWSACQWRNVKDGWDIVREAQHHFGDAGPEYLWYTAGANDVWQDSKFQHCLHKASDEVSAKECVYTMSRRVDSCSKVMLDDFFSVFPNTKVLHTGYDVPCFSKGCHLLDKAFFGSFCGSDTHCSISMGLVTQNIELADLSRRYKNRQYTPLNMMGTMQKAEGLLGADTGSPVFDQGSKCEWTKFCVHPLCGSPAANAWGDAWWKLYFSKMVDGLPLDLSHPALSLGIELNLPRFPNKSTTLVV